MSEEIHLKEYIRSIHDFPKPGIVFRDITPLLADATAFGETIRQLAEHYRDQPIDVVAAAKARGFIFAAACDCIGRRIRASSQARQVTLLDPRIPLRAGIPQRHSGNPQRRYRRRTRRVLLVDDLLATGGTMEACCRLIEHAGGTVAGFAFVIELKDLGGAATFKDYKLFSLMTYS